MSVQYVSDEAGNRTAVLVPIAEWERLQHQFPAEAVAASAKASAGAKLSKKEQFKKEFREAVREMKRMQAGEIPKTSLRDLLDELRDV